MVNFYWNSCKILKKEFFALKKRRIKLYNKSGREHQFPATKAMMPQASRPPALPVLLDPSSPPLPRSSTFSWTTKARPRMLLGLLQLVVIKVIMVSTMSTSATPLSSASKFPRSPACRLLASFVGEPCNAWSNFSKTYVTNQFHLYLMHLDYVLWWDWSGDRPNRSL